MILLMVQKAGEHQLRLVVYPIIYTYLHKQPPILPTASRDELVREPIHVRDQFNPQVVLATAQMFAERHRLPRTPPRGNSPVN